MAIIILIAAIITACSKYDDSDIQKQIDELSLRLEALEQSCDDINDRIDALQKLVDALEANDFITSVETIIEDGSEVGFIINFSYSDPITIYNNQQQIPTIGISKDDDGKYYWTLDGEFMMDESGEKIVASGTDGQDGQSSILSVGEYDGALYWKINNEWLLLDGEKVAVATDQASTSEVSYTQDDTTFTIIFGSESFTFLKSDAIIGFESYNDVVLATDYNQIKIVLPESLQEDNFAALMATITGSGGIGGSEIATKTDASATSWGIDIVAPTFTNGVYNMDAAVTITPPLGKEDQDNTAILEVCYIDTKGNKTSSALVFTFLKNTAEIAFDQADLNQIIDAGYASSVTDLILGEGFSSLPSGIIAIFSNLETLDLSSTAITNIEQSTFEGAASLKELELPEGITSVGSRAFYGCSSLENISLPSATNIGEYAFSDCASLTELEIASKDDTQIESIKDAFELAPSENIILTTSYANGVYVEENTLTIDGYSASFKEIILTQEAAVEDSEENEEDVDNDENASSMSLSDFSAENFPDTNYWIVNDEQASLADFVGIKAALVAANSSGQQISIEFSSLISTPSASSGSSGIFYDCDALVAVYMPEATDIGRYTFYDCGNLSTVSMPKVETINTSAFYGCSSLVALSLPELETLEGYVFERCSWLSDIYMPKLVDINSWAFYMCSSLETIDLENVESLGWYVFRGCTALKSVTLAQATDLDGSIF